MPIWLNIAIWCLWMMLAFDEFRTEIALHHWNANPIRTGLRGRASRTLYGRVSIVGFTVFTAFWFSWFFFH